MHDSASIINFIHSGSDNMFHRQFWLCCKDFYFLHNRIGEHKISQRYDEEKSYKYAALSNGSPVTLEICNEGLHNLVMVPFILP